MSISSANRKAGPYTGNGSTTAFPFSFKVFAASDVLVVSTDLTGLESNLTLTTHYTVDLNADQNANPGGTVNMLTAPASGYLLTITSQLQNLQPVTLTNQGGFYPKVINDALDRLTILVQQIGEAVSRSVKVGISSSASPDEMIAALAEASAAAVAAVGLAQSAAAEAAASAASVPADVLGASDIGTSVQAYDAAIAKTNEPQTWPSSQKSGNVTDNDGSFDLSAAGNNYTSAPTSAVAITFTNIAANSNKSGYIILTNASNYAYTAHANTKITTTDLTKIGKTGTHVLPYLCDGTDVFILGVWTKP